MTNSNVPPVERFKILQEYRKDLPHKLSSEEFVSRAEELAGIQEQEREHKANVEQIKAELKKREKFLAAERDRLSAIITTRTETRTVSCVERIDFDRNVRETRRLDFPEDDRRGLVESVPLTAAERQHQLDMFEKERTKQAREDAAAAEKAADAEKTKGEGAVVTKIRPKYPNEN